MEAVPAQALIDKGIVQKYSEQPEGETVIASLNIDFKNMPEYQEALAEIKDAALELDLRETEAAMSLQLANDDLSVIDDVKDKIVDLRGELTFSKVAFNEWSLDLVRDVGDVIDAFTDGQASAADTTVALQKLADANPAAQAYVAKVTPILNVLQQIIDKANVAKIAMQTVTPDMNIGDWSNPYADYEDQFKAQAYIREQERLQGLTKGQLALEGEIARVRKAAAKDGAILTDAQIRKIAQDNIAADNRRSEEGKKPKAEKQSAEDRAIERFDDSILKDTASTRAETEQYIALAGVYDKYGLSVERAAKEAEMLQVLQNKGVAITPQLREQVRGLADDWMVAAEANAKAKEKYDDFNSTVEGISSVGRDAFVGLITGANGFRSAIGNLMGALAQMAASRAFAMIWGEMGGDALIASGLRSMGMFAAGAGATSSVGVGTGVLYDAGGYTGPGGRKTPAGIVHKGEVVWSQTISPRPVALVLSRPCAAMVVACRAIMMVGWSQCRPFHPFR